MSNSSLINSLYDLEIQIATYSSLLVLPIGLVSNILNIIICMQKAIRKETIGFYSGMMSLFSIPLLIIGFIAIYPSTSNLLYNSNFDCVAILYTFRIAVQMFAWLNVMVALDRMMCVTFPTRFKFIYKRTFLFTTVLILFSLVLLANSANFFFKIITVNSLANNSTQIFCTTKIQNLLLVRDIISQLMRSILPFLFELILNAILVHKLLQSRRRANLHSSMKREHKFVFTIVILNFTFILTNLPLLISIIYLNLLNYQFKSQTSSEAIFVANFFYSMAAIFSSFMPASTLFINIAFNKYFRKEFVTVFSCFKADRSIQVITTKLRNVSHK